MTPLTIGFLPLTDAAPLIAAAALGFDRAEGVALTLRKETSWSSLRDRLVAGAAHGAHLLAPAAVALRLGLGGARAAVRVPLMLNSGGLTVCVSTAFAARMGVVPADPWGLGAAIAAAARDGGGPPRAAVPFGFSTHHYLLRYWLAAVGVDPDREISLMVTPPPLMVAALAAGRADMVIVGEPWGSLAVEAGAARIAMPAGAIWADAPEKGLAMLESFITGQPGAARALTRAAARAAWWCDQPSNRSVLAEILAGPAYLDAPTEVIERALSGRFTCAPDGSQLRAPEFLRFHRAGAPNAAAARQLYAQMARWGHAPADMADQAAAIFDAALYYNAAPYRREGEAAGREGRGALNASGFFDSAINR